LPFLATKRDRVSTRMGQSAYRSRKF
jgi:hypothetical protein